VRKYSAGAQPNLNVVVQWRASDQSKIGGIRRVWRELWAFIVLVRYRVIDTMDPPRNFRDSHDKLLRWILINAQKPSFRHFPEMRHLPLCKFGIHSHEATQTPNGEQTRSQTAWLHWHLASALRTRCYRLRHPKHWIQPNASLFGCQNAAPLTANWNRSVKWSPLTILQALSLHPASELKTAQGWSLRLGLSCRDPSQIFGYWPLQRGVLEVIGTDLLLRFRHPPEYH